MATTTRELFGAAGINPLGLEVFFFFFYFFICFFNVKGGPEENQ